MFGEKQDNKAGQKSTRRMSGDSSLRANSYA